MYKKTAPTRLLHEGGKAIPARFERATPGFGGEPGARPSVTARVQPVGFRSVGARPAGAPVRSVPPNSTRQGPYGVQESERRLRVVDGVLTVRDVATLLRVSTATIYALVEKGDLVHFRVSNAIRFERASVEQFIAKRRGES